MPDTDTLLKFIPPALTALLPALAAWWRERRVSRNKRVAWGRAVADATAQVEYTRAWLAARLEAAPREEQADARRRAAEDLERIRWRLESARVRLQPPANPPSRATALRRLIRAPRARGSLGATLTVLYYLSYLWLALAVVTAMVFAVPESIGGIEGGAESLAEDIAISVATAVIVLLIGLAPVVALRLLLKALGDSEETGSPATPPAPETPGAPFPGSGHPGRGRASRRIQPGSERATEALLGGAEPRATLGGAEPRATRRVTRWRRRRPPADRCAPAGSAARGPGRQG